MKKNTYFSIIIPVYNTKIEYIDECLSSLFKQSYKNYEIIIINDGSNNEVKKHLEIYKKHKNIIIINQKNHGQYYSRVKGINASKGDYVLFLDSDDLLNKNSLNALNKIINNKKYDMITFSCSRFTNNISNVLYSTDYFSDGELTKKEVINELLNLHINGVCLKCIKKEIAKLSIKDIDTSLREGEDLGQSCKYVLKSNSFYNTTEKIYLYRYNEELKEYYDTKIDNIDFLMPVYNQMFNNNNDYDEYKTIFKENAIKAIIYSSFKICLKETDYSKQKELLDSLLNHKIVNVLINMSVKISFFYSFLFKLLVNKNYSIINLLSKIYRLFS